MKIYMYIKWFKFNKSYLHKTPKIILLKIHTEIQQIYLQPPIKQVFIKGKDKVNQSYFSYSDSHKKFQ